MLVIFIFIFGISLSAVVTSDDRNNRGYFSLYDYRDVMFHKNSLIYKDFNRSFVRNGYYKFDNFSNIQDYDGKPVLFVYQPDDNVNELHGYFFIDGIYSLFYDGNKDNPTYKRIRDFFDGSTEAVTPYAATMAHPYFFEYPMVKLNNSEHVSTNFAVLFAAPKNVRVKGVDEHYVQIIRINFYKDPFEKYDVRYLVYGRDFCPYINGGKDLNDAAATEMCSIVRKRRKVSSRLL